MHIYRWDIKQLGILQMYPEYKIHNHHIIYIYLQQ
jgi:hypothetical protein